MDAAAQHVVIVGAGMMGLTAALELRVAGYRVSIVERGRAMEQSSWAAAGMLAVHDPENDPALLPLSLASRALYPGFLKQVEALSGLRVPLRTVTTLQGVAGTGTAVAALPALQTEHYRFTQLAESSLDPRDLCAALPPAVVAAGVVLREQTAVAAVAAADGPPAAGTRVTVVLESGERMDADQVLLTTGAWTGQLTPALPIAPRKGQMIEVTLDGPVLPMVIRTPRLYLVPRGDGRVIVGATVEHAGFSRGVDDAVGEQLWQHAAALWPPIRQGRITAQWSGLRPGYAAGIPDALPAIGPLQAGVWVATAHFRNGILLAPATARLLRQMLQGDKPDLHAEIFSPSRFAAAALSLCI